MNYDILITGCKLLPLVTNTAITEPGFLAITGSTIAALGPLSELPANARASVLIEAAGLLAMPGLVNTHCHAPMTLFRGLADDLSLKTWLTEHIFPAEAKTVNPDMVYWTSQLAAAEMIMSGTTTVGDGYFYEGVVAQALAEAGLRAVAGQGVIDFPAPGVPDPTCNIDEAARFIKTWQGKHPLITPAVFCHSAYTCSPETLKKAKSLVRSTGTRLFIHAAETREEVDEVRSRFGATPIMHLHNLGVLDDQTVLVHCVHLTTEEKTIIKESGSMVSTCPESNMKLGSGVSPVPELLDMGIPVGLGTDGCASNNDLDLFREMNTCAKLHKVMQSNPTVLPADQLLSMATSGGGRVLGLAAGTGRLAPGCFADVILLDLSQPRLTPFYSADILVNAACGADVTDAIINGRLVMRNRRLLCINLPEVMANVRELSQQLR